MTAAAASLPPLRDELAVMEGPPAHDGSPTWTLHDPLGNRYFRLSWPAFEVLSRWHLGGAQAIVQSIADETVLDLDPEDVDDVVEFLARGQLLKPISGRDVDRLVSIADAHKTSWLTWLLHHYLFFRLPLVRPDRWLSAAQPLVAWAGSRTFRWATVMALAAGLFLVSRQWESFTTTFVDHFSITGLAAFAVALGFAKIIHELGHAFTAKTFGCRVPTMGVAFLVLWPMLYTDVNDAWRLTDRRRRLLVGGAGILSELTLAAWATLVWGLSPDGSTVKAMAFTLAATTWISSLAINLSPFMRFDGYFLAMDALDQPNLHPRSFALARWHLREVLFDLGEAAPEHLPRGQTAAMIAFAWAVWIYRLLLFLGIAVLVYHFFIKVVGIVLFVVEIGWFVVKPIAGEIAQWRQRAGRIVATRRSRLSLLAVLILAALAVIPWSGRVAAPAVLKAQKHAVLYAPGPARLVSIDVADGQNVDAGAVLARLENPDTLHRLTQAERRIGVLKYELSSISFDESFRNRTQTIAEELEAAIAERSAMADELARLTLTAPFAGAVTDLSPFVHPGQWVNPKEPILGVRQGVAIDAFVAEEDLPRLTPGAEALFIPEGGSARVAATVAAIDRAALKALTEPSLAVPYGGTIPARFDQHNLVPDTAIYRVRLHLEAETVPFAAPLRGQVHMDGERRSLLGGALRAMVAVLIREWGM